MISTAVKVGIQAFNQQQLLPHFRHNQNFMIPNNPVSAVMVEFGPVSAVSQWHC